MDFAISDLKRQFEVIGRKSKSSKSNDNQKKCNITVNSGSSLDQQIVPSYDRPHDKFDHIHQMLQDGKDDDVIKLLSLRGVEVCKLRDVKNNWTLYMWAEQWGRLDVVCAMETYASCVALWMRMVRMPFITLFRVNTVMLYVTWHVHNLHC